MVAIERLQEHHITQVEGLVIAEEQIQFAGTAEDFLDDRSETVHPHVVLNDNRVIGFFKIDTHYPKAYPFCTPHSLGLRAFALDKNQQGKGLGTAAMKALKPYLKQNYPDFPRIYLTVNCRNPGAFRCYIKAGFLDTRDLYEGGSAGPQHIMRMDIS